MKIWLIQSWDWDDYGKTYNLEPGKGGFLSVEAAQAHCDKLNEERNARRFATAKHSHEMQLEEYIRRSRTNVACAEKGLPPAYSWLTAPKPPDPDDAYYHEICYEVSDEPVEVVE